MQDQTLKPSYRYCRHLARREAKNFRYAFRALDAKKRAAMEVLYAFMRCTDDIADDETASRTTKLARLNEWQETLRAATEGDASLETESVWPAVADVVSRYEIPQQPLLAVIDGMRFDLGSETDEVRIETFAELQRYCYQVAGVVGLCCIRIWGFDESRTEEAEAAAIDCGTAFQLTNVLRDVKEDVERGRIYLPLDDLRKCNCEETELLACQLTPNVKRLLQMEAARARDFYQRGERLLTALNDSGRAILCAMMNIYRALLDRIEQRNYDVFSRRITIPKWRKLWIAWRARGRASSAAGVKPHVS